MWVDAIQLKEPNGQWSLKTCAYFSSANLQHHKDQVVTMIDGSTWALVQESRHKGFCHNRFRPNLIIGCEEKEPGISPWVTVLGIGNAKFFLVEKKSICHENCPLFQYNGMICFWKSKILYARIRQPGQVCLGDEVVTDVGKAPD